MFILTINTMLFLAVMFMFLNHPLTLGLALLLQTISVCITTGMMSMNYWFSYMIFLVMIGGMLVLFIYMTSIASNEKFKFSIKFLLLIIPIFLISSSLIIGDTMFFDIILKNDLMNQNNNFKFQLSLNKFINFPLNSIFYLIIIYLLITLIMVVKITDIRSGPLRQTN